MNLLVHMLCALLENIYSLVSKQREEEEDEEKVKESKEESLVVKIRTTLSTSLPSTYTITHHQACDALWWMDGEQ